MMKGIQIHEFGGTDVLQYRELPIPQPGENQVLIRVAAAGVNYADIMTRKGVYHGAGHPPLTPGLDVAGTVIEVGSSVTSIKPGQRVVAFPDAGSYAEYTISQEALTFAIPDEVDFETAAAFPTVGFTVHQLLAEVTRFQPGETILIHAAAGGIGTTAIQVAKKLGAGLIIGSVGHDSKKDVVLELGAHHVVNSRSSDYVQQVLDLTNGQGINVILNSIAGSVFESDLGCLARFGRLAIFGHASGEAGSVRSTDLHSSCRSILGYSMGTNKKYRPETYRKPMMELMQWIKEGSIRPMISDKLHLSEAGKAHEVIESRMNKGKIILVP
jgi:NADPH2:quinone reductase